VNIDRSEITGLVLAGGRGKRMGGADKGLVPLLGKPLIAYVIERLAPQVSRVLISANRNPDQYRAFAADVLADDSDLEPYAGPLAGLRAGLTACPTRWLAVAPCDTPRLPLDLVQRLAQSMGAARVAVAVTATGVQPLCCLIDRSLAPDLETALAQGERKVGAWLDRVGAVAVPFAEAQAFANINSAEQLASAAV
jgi:molybdopterin-guanine dinucleotide biosynthesis protein A